MSANARDSTGARCDPQSAARTSAVPHLPRNSVKFVLGIATSGILAANNLHSNETPMPLRPKSSCKGAENNHAHD
jgi:hypothetical protein